MRLVVTGAAGFIGSQYVRSLLNTDRGKGITHITVVDSLTYAGNLANLAGVAQDPRYTFVQSDICDSETMNDILNGNDAIVHFAAESHVDRSITGSAEFIRTNVLGTHTLLEASREQKIGRFVHVSTDEVYGSIESGSWPETHPLLPNSPYAASKASSDLLVRSFFRTHHLDTVTTRCSNNYGFFQFPEKLIPLFVTNLIDGKKVPLYGSGTNVRDWLHVDDHCNGIHLALTKGKSGEIYNISSEYEFSVLDITKMIVKSVKGTDAFEDWVEYVPDRPFNDSRYFIDSSKLRALGWKQKKDSDFLRQFIENLAQTI